MTPDFEEQRFRLGQTVGVDKPPVIKPQTGPKVVHEHRKTGHDGKHAPWTTELITATRCETAQRTRKGFSNVRVMLIELLVPLLTLVGDFHEVFFLGRLCRPLAYGGRSTHGGRYSGGEEEEPGIRLVRDRTTSNLLTGSDVFGFVRRDAVLVTCVRDVRD
jgi:hypothetical protein